MYYSSIFLCLNESLRIVIYRRNNVGGLMFTDNS